jgi:hypothetical protein
MRQIRTIGVWAVFAGLAALLGGCGGSLPAREVKLNPVLVSPSVFEQGEKGQALYRYRNPGANLASYDKILVDPVLIAKDGELDQKTLQNYKGLANNAYVYLTEELRKDYQVVTSPEPNTIRLQFAIQDADQSKPVRNFLGTFMPIGMGVSLVRYETTGEPTGVGEITGEMRFTDAVSGELLGAALDRRVGGAAPKGIIDTWHNADEALKFWAKKTRYALCLERGGANCVNPD